MIWIRIILHRTLNSKTYLKRFEDIQNDKVDVDWSPGNEEHKTDHHQKQVCPSSPCQFSLICLDSTSTTIGL